MSYRTTADEKRDELRDCLRIARILTGDLTNPDIQGIEDYNHEFIDNMAQMNVELIKMARVME